MSINSVKLSDLSLVSVWEEESTYLLLLLAEKFPCLLQTDDCVSAESVKSFLVGQLSRSHEVKKWFDSETSKEFKSISALP